MINNRSELGWEKAINLNGRWLKKDTNVVDYHIDWNTLAMLTPIARVGFCQMVKEAGAADAAAGL